jgi:hypothetical protein
MPPNLAMYAAVCAILVTAASCKSKKETGPDPSELDPALKAKLEARIDAFKNRKRYPILTTEVLKTIPDADVELAIQDFIDCKIEAGGGDERKALDALSPGFRAVFTTWRVEAEVSNGGFNQYFWNSSGEFAKDAVAGFDLIGTPALGRLMERAIAIYKEDADKAKKFKDRGSLEAFSESYEGNRLNALDREFYDQTEELTKARLRFIRAKPEQFVGQCSVVYMR